MEGDQQQPGEQLAPAAVSGTNRGGRHSSVGGKQSTETLAPAVAPAAATVPAAAPPTVQVPPALRFQPQSVVTPAAALQQPG